MYLLRHSIKHGLDSGLDSGLWTLDSGLWTLDSKKPGLWTQKNLDLQ